MDVAIDYGLAASRWLQANYPQLHDFMELVSNLGLFEFYLAVIPLIYWTIHKRFGKHLAFVLILSYTLNGALKQFLRQPRPNWLDSGLGEADDGSYGIPSGHVQNATVMYLLLAGWVRRAWLWILALLFVGLMALSRVYLGVHFLHDVGGGFLLGLIVLLLYAGHRRFLYEDFRNRILGQRLLFVLALTLVLAALYTVVILALGAPDQSVAWAEFVAGAERISLDDVVTGLALLSGVGMGLVLEASRVHFLVDGPLWQRGLRYVLGIVITIIIWRGLGALFPSDPLWIAIPLRLIRYLLTGLWVSYYAPMAFVRLRLAQAADIPEVSLSVTKNGLLKG